MERVLYIHKTFGDAALAEEYIEGREFYVGVLGNQEPIAFPPIEMDFSGLPEGSLQGHGQQGQVRRGQRPVSRAPKPVVADLEPELQRQAAEGRRSTPTARCASATTAASTCG